MIIAEQKRKENIAEYLLYMYQVEDLIRANQLDIEQVEKTLINQFDVPYDVKREMREWYKSLISMLEDEKKEESGHLNILNNIVENLDQLHRETLQEKIDNFYLSTYEKARPNLEALRMRSGHHPESDIQVAMNGLYGLLLLKLKKTRITEETEKAFETISDLIAQLNAKYMDMKGKEEIP